jgi:hypothetical protein
VITRKHRQDLVSDPSLDILGPFASYPGVYSRYKFFVLWRCILPFTSLFHVPTENPKKLESFHCKQYLLLVFKLDIKNRINLFPLKRNYTKHRFKGRLQLRNLSVLPVRYKADMLSATSTSFDLRGDTSLIFC